MAKMKTVNGVELSKDEVIVFYALREQLEADNRTDVRKLAKKLAVDNPMRTMNGWESLVHRFVSEYPKWATLDLNELVGEMEEGISTKYSLENQKLRNQLLQRDVELKNLRNELVTRRDIMDDVASGIKALPKVKSIPISKPQVGKPVEEEVVLMLSDLHINEVVDLEETEGYNEYNFDIFCNRYWFLITEVLKLVQANRTNKKIEVLHIDALGDMFNDIHREEHMRTNQFNPTQAVIMGSYVLAQGIAMLIPHFKKVVFTGLVGNEGRLDKIKPAALKSNNFDYLSYHIISLCLAEYVKAGGIVFNIPRSPELVIERMGKKFLIIHGDSIKSWSGIPFYGIERHTYKQQRKRRLRGGFDYMVMGHFHTDNKLREVLMNGALVGVSMHALHNLAEIGVPSQKLFGINEKYGVSWMYEINCSEARENGFVYSTNLPAGDVVLRSVIHNGNGKKAG